MNEETNIYDFAKSVGLTHDSVRRAAKKAGVKHIAVRTVGKSSLYIYHAADLLAAIRTYTIKGRCLIAVSVCYDCTRPYGDQHGFPDLIIPLWAWKQIAPAKDAGGLLCPSCICKRLYQAGIQCEGAFLSGPIKSVLAESMEAIRQRENQTTVGTTPASPRDMPAVGEGE